jgi:hypothetical protein
MLLLQIVWIAYESLAIRRQSSSLNSFWARPGLFVYTSIGNLLLYKLLWSVNVALWSHYSVNYISILGLSNRRTNALQLTNGATTWLLLLFINIVVYYRANSNADVLYDTFLRYACPLVMLFVTVFYLAYERYLAARHKQSVGLFSSSMMWSFALAPFVTPSFREIFAADYLTSFTKVSSLFISSKYLLVFCCSIRRRIIMYNDCTSLLKHAKLHRHHDYSLILKKTL